MEGSKRGRSGVDAFLPNYKLGRTLGIGSFGKVKIAEHKLTGLKVAVKVLNRRKIMEMSMEEKERGRPQEDEARRFFQQIISGLECCHKNMVVHRDLKPENLLLDSECNLKIADFGLSNVMRDGHFLKTNCGSTNYAAPEVISRKLYAGPEIDVWSCGVVLYALLCGSLPFDDENLHNLNMKIKAGTYALPSHVSPGARDLITRMLIVDPMKRITIPKIRDHPWFRTHLPRYLAVPSPDTMQQANKIDEYILKEAVKMGFDQNQLVESLCNGIQNEATVTYYLLLDNWYRAPSHYLGAEFQEIMECGSAYILPGKVTAPTRARCFPAHMDYQGTGVRAKGASERKWALGLQSRAHPHQIMMEVLKALQELNVCWKKIGSYNVKCRSTPYYHESTISTNNDPIKSPHVVKFEVQLYKAREDKYLLDLQRVQGSQCLFLDLCAALLVQLQVI